MKIYNFLDVLEVTIDSEIKRIRGKIKFLKRHNKCSYRKKTFLNLEEDICLVGKELLE